MRIKLLREFRLALEAASGIHKNLKNKCHEKE